MAEREVFAVTEHHNCSAYMEDDLYYEGTLVVALYESRQTAEQHADRDGLSVTKMTVRTRLPFRMQRERLTKSQRRAARGAK